MRRVQAAEAESHMAELLAEVERGETIAITRQGRVIARLVPDSIPAAPDFAKLKAEIAEFRRSTPSLTIDEISSARHEGHKY